MACLIKKPPSRKAEDGAGYRLVSSAFAGQRELDSSCLGEQNRAQNRATAVAAAMRAGAVGVVLPDDDVGRRRANYGCGNSARQRYSATATVTGVSWCGGWDLTSQGEGGLIRGW